MASKSKTAATKPSKKVDVLTPAQEGKLDDYINKWKAITISTEAIDRDAATDAVTELYQKYFNLDKPDVVWAESPEGWTDATEELPDINEREAFRNVLNNFTGLGYEKSRRISETLESDSQREHVTRLIDTMFPGILLGNFFYGQHRLSDQAWFDYLLTEKIFKFTSGFDRRIATSLRLFQNAGWFMYRQNRVYLCPRPVVLSFNEIGEPHSLTGPAIAFGDDVKQFRIDGVQVPEIVVMNPEAQTLGEIEGEQNAEVKRLRIERLGWDNYLVARNAKLLDHRVNDIEGTEESLMQYEENGRTNNVLVCICPSTGRIYAMDVGDECLTCKTAQDYLANSDSSKIIGRS